MVVDSHGRAYVGEFGFDLMGGAPLEPGVLLRVDPDGTVTRVAGDLWFPNGSVITEDGTLVWVADCFGSRVVRVRSDGQIAEEIQVGTGVFACALGGADGRTLFLCTAPDFEENRRKNAREAALMVTRVDTPGAGLP